MTEQAEMADVSRFLPLTDLAFNVLIVLTDQDLHGYALLKELRSRTGREKLRTGTVYAALARLQDDGLVQEADVTPMEDEDRRRRYYRVTDLGRLVAKSEANRLVEILAFARNKHLLPHVGPGAPR